MARLVLTPPMYVVKADYYMFKLFYMTRMLQGYRSRLGLGRRKNGAVEARVAPTFRYVPELRKVCQQYLELMVSQYEALTNNALDVISKASMELNYVAYLLDTPLPDLVVLPVIAIPPDLTWGKPPAIEPSTWYGITFITTSKSKSVHKVFFTRLALVIGRMVFSKWLDKVPVLRDFYEKTVNKYVARGRSETHARALARRDVVRVWLGNTWLVATLDALRASLVEPEEVRLPYHLAKDPQQLHQMIDPADALPPAKAYKWRNYTWAKLAEILEQASHQH